jgi:hypothetical protein
VTQQQNNLIFAFLHSRMRFDILTFAEAELLGSYPKGTNKNCQAGEDWTELLLRQIQPKEGYSALQPLKSVDVDMLWLFPRVTLSLISSHIFCVRHHYFYEDGKIIDSGEWLINRLRLLRQLDIFASVAGGFGSSLAALFRQDPSLGRRLLIPHSGLYGTLSAREKLLTFPVAGTICHVVLQREAPDWLQSAPPTFFQQACAALLSAIDRKKELSSRNWAKLFFFMGAGTLETLLAFLMQAVLPFQTPSSGDRILPNLLAYIVASSLRRTGTSMAMSDVMAFTVPGMSIIFINYTVQKEAKKNRFSRRKFP